MVLRALIAVLLVPALGAGMALGVLQAMAAYTGAGLGDVMQACAPARVEVLLAPECEPVQAHYWLVLLSAATAAAGFGLLLLRLLGGRTDWSVFSFRGLIASLIVATQWAILVAAAYLAKTQWLPEMPTAHTLALAAPAAALFLWLTMSALKLRGE